MGEAVKDNAAHCTKREGWGAGNGTEGRRGVTCRPPPKGWALGAAVLLALVACS